MNLIDISLIQCLLKTPLGTFELIVSVIMRLCVMIIFISILINFVESSKHNKVEKEKRSVVETGTMVLFFFGFYWLLKSGYGSVELENTLLKISLMIIGILIIMFGTVFNVLGRLALGSNWANQVKIYKDHTLVRTGVYQIVRHPLYASLIWMFFAASFVFFSYYAFLANLLVFIPFMYYRAKQEEQVLSKKFADYSQYKKTVGMFFPKGGF